MRPHRRSPESMEAFYDWFHRFYGLIEANLAPGLAEAIRAVDPAQDRFRGESCLEMACGSGSLGLLVAPRFGYYEGRDRSARMLDRARRRWLREAGPELRSRYAQPPFRPGDILAPLPEGDRPWDRIVLSFAIHLFPPEEEAAILSRLFAAARNGLLVIDHSRSPSLVSSIVEWAEGSWYDEYLRVDFSAIAAGMGASFVSREAGGCLVMEFLRAGR
jgi:SAM-dependent methyltransferase